MIASLTHASGHHEPLSVWNQAVSWWYVAWEPSCSLQLKVFWGNYIMSRIGPIEEPKKCFNHENNGDETCLCSVWKNCLARLLCCFSNLHGQREISPESILYPLKNRWKSTKHHEYSILHPLKPLKIYQKTMIFSLKSPEIHGESARFDRSPRFPADAQGAVAMVSGAQGEGVGEATAQPTVKTRTKVPKAARDPWMITLR